ncbi:MAG: S-methyl-5-thioribose-1-phosphate isomerase [Candidatus Lokiarchaeota archaeon]|nr:S-methyl-5-thioribose-1-phosphate isomerase [Candidatus Lokiarchaeota archaeon]
MEELLKNAEKIKSLEIQGAANVALSAIQFLSDYAYKIEKDCQCTDDWFNKLNEAKEILFKTRETEPTMRNGLYYIINKLKKNRDQIECDKILELISQYKEEYKKMIEDARLKIAEFGARRIPDTASENQFIVMTHCHSSFVDAILLKAKQQGKIFKVISTETRPRHQGRKSVKILHEAGIDVIHVVDSAMRWAVNYYEVDLILIGADSITSEGTVLNKIGSRLLALVAHEEHVPFYVASPLLKYNPQTSLGILEKIEMRSPNEIWENPPKGVKILNPAFETVSRRYIDGLISEAGIFASSHVPTYFGRIYPELMF